MQFVKNGPDIPNALLQAHEDGEVVFFCGAGISYPAGLPDFKGLVEKTYSLLGTNRLETEDAAFIAEQYDATLNLLERRYPGGRLTVRTKVMEALRPKWARKGATQTHKSIVELATNRKGECRLVTTNFDRIFDRVVRQRKLAIPSFAAPRLPVPKNSRWHGIVYLHGLLPTGVCERELNSLILSSGDFGLAYLTERWASRFVSELFRNYVVCFVGYSLNDPVMRYMMDALAADRMMGEPTPQAYALASALPGSERETSNSWAAKGVRPILYAAPKNLDHSALHSTLEEWANTHRDGVSGKERIVVQYALAQPLASTRQDDFVGRMLWALSDSEALPAKRFADHDPLPSLNWLDALLDNRFAHADLRTFKVTPDTEEDAGLSFSLLNRPARYALAPRMTLFWARSHAQWDRVMHELARWLSRHYNDPGLLMRIIDGGPLNPQFMQLIKNALCKHPPPGPISKIWDVILSGQAWDESPLHLTFYDWERRFRKEGMSHELMASFRRLMAPRVRFRKPLRLFDNDDESTSHDRVRDIVDFDLTLGIDDAKSSLARLSRDAQWSAALPSMLDHATILLRDALDLMAQLEAADADSDQLHWQRPSIEAHPQNEVTYDWLALVDLVRDAWLSTLRVSPARARLEIHRWLEFKYPIFRRLAYFAVATSEVFPPNEALEILLERDGKWLWATDVQREMYALLTALAPKLSREGLSRLEAAILLGPSDVSGDSDPLRAQQRIDREVWLLLAKCRNAGADLGPLAASRLQSLSKMYPHWRLASDRRDEFPVWTGADDEWRDRLAVPSELNQLIPWLREHPSGDSWRPDDWSERCKADFRKAAVALLRLAKERHWIADRWHEALNVWTEEPYRERSWRYLSARLMSAPDEFILAIARPLSWWLRAQAPSAESNSKPFSTLLLRIAEMFRANPDAADEVADDPIFRAINHPMGILADAALQRWFKSDLEDGQRLPDNLSSLLTILCDRTVPVFRHARIKLAQHVILLLRVDPSWTAQYLLPIFQWEVGNEAIGAWQAYLGSPRLYRNFLEATKASFLATAAHYSDLGRYGDQYAAILTFAALEPLDIFTVEELRTATTALPPDGLRRAVHALVDGVEASNEQRVNYWRNRVRPYLRTIWPQSVDNRTRAVSDAFARLAIATSNAFPEALRELRNWLQPIQFPDHLVHLLHASNLHESAPEPALDFLHIIIGDNRHWPPQELRSCLDGIAIQRPELREDPRFISLEAYLKMHNL